jgi:RNA polymerase sigma factor (sigma-70 family)
MSRNTFVQQTMLKALAHADQFRFQLTMKTWLTSIAMNEVRQVYRSKWQTCAVPSITEKVKSDRLPWVECPSASYQARERNAFIRRPVWRLPELYRFVVELRDLQLLPQQEVAARLFEAASG